MENRRPSGGNFVASLIVFALAAIIAIMLIITAIVIWLSELTGSFIFSALIIGGFCGVVALIVYLISIRDAVARMQEQIDTIYEVAQTAKAGYEWVTGKLFALLSIRDEMRGKKEERSK